MTPKEQKQIKKQIDQAQWQFEMRVEAAGLEVIEMSKDIAKAIGEISIDEAKNAIIKLFIQLMNEPRYYGEFKAKD